MNEPLISFITCVYNQRKEVFEETVKSVLPHLSYAEWIIVDDGSDPDASGVLKDVVQSITVPERVHLERLSSNAGLSVARNGAISKALGKWIVVLDSDDQVPLDLGNTLLSLEESVSIVSGCAFYFRSQTQFEFRNVSRFAEMFKGRCRSPLNPFFWYDFYYHGLIARRDVFHRLGNYDPHFRVGEDQEILIRFVLSEGEERVRFLNKLVYLYCDNPEGVCSLQSDAVYAGYCHTMCSLMTQIEPSFINCRQNGVIMVDGAKVEEYEYYHRQHGWLSYDQAKGIYK